MNNIFFASTKMAEHILEIPGQGYFVIIISRIIVSKLGLRIKSILKIKDDL